MCNLGLFCTTVAYSLYSYGQVTCSLELSWHLQIMKRKWFCVGVKKSLWAHVCAKPLHVACSAAVMGVTLPCSLQQKCPGFVLSVLVKVGRGRLPAFSECLWFICVPALKSEMRKKVFCACTGAVPVLLCDVLVSFDTEECSVFVSEEDVQAFYACPQVHVEKIAAAGYQLWFCIYFFLSSA